MRSSAGAAAKPHYYHADNGSRPYLSMRSYHGDENSCPYERYLIGLRVINAEKRPVIVANYEISITGDVRIRDL